MKIGTIVKHKHYGFLVVVGEEHDIITNTVVLIGVDKFGVRYKLTGNEPIVKDAETKKEVKGIIPKSTPKRKTKDTATVMKELYAPKPGKDFPTHSEIEKMVAKHVVDAINELSSEYATLDFASSVAADFARIEANKCEEKMMGEMQHIEIGRDVPTFEQCYQLAERVAKKLIEKIEKQEIPVETGASIKTKLELLSGDFRLDASAIKNLPKPVVNQIMPNKQGGFGGQSFVAQVRASEDDQVPGFLEDKLVAGENVTLTVSGTGRERTITIAASGSGTSLPDQTGNAGKFLKTNGTTASWESIPTEVSDEAYNAATWNGVTDVAPSKNAVRDKIEAMLAAGGITRTVVVTSGDTLMGSSANTDYMYFVAGLHVMSLPAAAGNTNRYVVKNNHSAAITVDTSGAETVEGSASITIQPGGSESFMSDGSNWYITD